MTAKHTSENNSRERAKNSWKNTYKTENKLAICWRQLDWPMHGTRVSGLRYSSD